MYVYFSMSGQRLQSLIRCYGSINRTLEEMPAVRLQLGDGTIYEKEGRIESISGVLDRQTGSGSLRAVFPNAERVLLSGSLRNIYLSRRPCRMLFPHSARSHLRSGDKRCLSIG